ncbi:MAG: excalibur calcium-binding domain-containing protein, partial [Marivivens sp.]
MVWVYTKYASDPAYFAAERAAKTGRVGLWDQSNPQPPWEYRHPTRDNPPALASKKSGRCGDKRYCKEMRDCAEARFYLEECGVKTLDGNRDGTPCESLCR